MNNFKMCSIHALLLPAFIVLCSLSASGQILTGASVVKSVLGGSPLVINEFMASNKKTIADPQGEYDDWIELYNNGSSDINLSGIYLSDKEDNPKKWQFPDNTIIKSNGYLIVWADENGKASPGLHANFKLSASGEIVTLSNNSGIIDSISFGPQTDDISFGRYPNGSGPFKIMKPTPGSANDNTLSVEEYDYMAINQVTDVYPNPLKPDLTAQLSVSIARQGNFSIEVRDVTGRIVSQTIAGYLSAGSHKLNWNELAVSGGKCSPGVYFLILKSESNALSKPAMLVVE